MTEHKAKQDFDYDYLVVGSGFGGSVSAHRLTEKGYSVAVVESGKRWHADNLPSSNWQFWRWLWRPMLGLRGFFNIRWFRHVLILQGNAVGGGSVTYANTLLVPKNIVWQQGSWAGLKDWAGEMPAHYATAKKMLGVTENRILGPADYALKEMAEDWGCGDSFYRTQVGVFFGDEGEEPGKEYADPYFGGEGPARNSCIACGGCMVGCRHNAKNSLDKNYLYFAEKQGAEVIAETKVVDVRPLGAADGSDGYEVTAVSSTSLMPLRKRRWRVRSVVFAASSLGTQELLFKLRDRGSLPNISSQLGRRVRTNAESLIGVRLPGDPQMDKGIAIGSGVYLDEHTHIEATRYPRGSDAMGLLVTAMTRGNTGATRIAVWLKTILKLLFTRPIQGARMLVPFGLASQTIIFLCMQTLEGHIDMRYQRPWYWPFKKSMVSHGEKIPAYIPQASDFAQRAADKLGGMAGSLLTEVLFNIPATAHCMGGAAIGKNAEEGVIDERNRVFGYRNMYICDGSMLAANLGVNPSLTITALTEHAMSHIPAKLELS
ncbi:GMC oxidoreductase [Spongiibacter sp.]|uniref:GMC oxidoreductase n=1 Tax=Spongiibacter sp. TaxID=2024860 RepID=UPI003563471C